MKRSSLLKNRFVLKSMMEKMRSGAWLERHAELVGALDHVRVAQRTRGAIIAVTPAFAAVSRPSSNG
jgi:hypothetical protein